MALLMAIVAGTLIAVELLTAAAGQPRSLWSGVPLPEAPEVRMAILIALLLFFVAVMALEARSRPPGMTLPVEGGAVVLPEAAVLQIAERAFSGHPDVVRSRVRVRSRGGAVEVSARVYLRPGADAAALEPVVREAAVAGLRGAFGAEPTIGRLDLRVLTVARLHRHL